MKRRQVADSDSNDKIVEISNYFLHKEELVDVSEFIPLSFKTKR